MGHLQKLGHTSYFTMVFILETRYGWRKIMGIFPGNSLIMKVQTYKAASKEEDRSHFAN